MFLVKTQPGDFFGAGNGVDKKNRFTTTQYLLTGQDKIKYPWLTSNPAKNYFPVILDCTKVQWENLFCNLTSKLHTNPWFGDNLYKEIGKFQCGNMKADPKQDYLDKITNQETRLDQLYGCQENVIDPKKRVPATYQDFVKLTCWVNPLQLSTIMDHTVYHTLHEDGEHVQQLHCRIKEMDTLRIYISMRCGIVLFAIGLSWR